jgi:hypothetical protein
MRSWGSTTWVTIAFLGGGLSEKSYKKLIISGLALFYCEMGMGYLGVYVDGLVGM